MAFPAFWRHLEKCQKLTVSKVDFRILDNSFSGRYNHIELYIRFMSRRAQDTKYTVRSQLSTPPLPNC
jgi:hypothetical protein